MTPSSVAVTVVMLVTVGVAVTDGYRAPDYRRVCPVNDIEGRTSCVAVQPGAVVPEVCSSDAQCGGTQRCCSYGCSRECLTTCPPCGPGQQCRILELCTALGCERQPAACLPADGQY
ncbi:uncharacterized protein LOC119094070 [Pollicipes pollicipes]|uniref:uncharacterized protein LOC119094020 n=1 Tax=Pollicipes pollicipes TaxID=41117 RepID=UPI001884CC4C|nr:uncharacterized protein LOC119094020 [Pollicipes pollicipes]XP_037073045.1 uncharacterized protein LOC119094070 [Pollicipes pollicipes]